MQKRSIALLALFLLASVLAYYYYYYEAESLMFTGPAGTLVLVGSVFLTGFLLSLPRGHGHAHAHDHGHDHDHAHHHGGPEHHEQHEHPAMPPTGKQG